MILLNKVIIAVWLLMAMGSALAAQSGTAITLYAASSLKDALDAVIKARQAHSLVPVKPVYAASSTLARQIEQGAPADVFIAADTDWMDYLAQRKLLLHATRVNLLSNRLVLIAPAASKLSLAIAPNFPLATALGAERLALADPDSVPAGRYGKASLQALGVWNDVARKLARTENVRAALLLVARGETPLGIVYASDAVAESKVRVLGEFPARTHAPIVYPAAILAHSRASEARALLEFLRSSEARALWRHYGFGTVP